MTTGELPSGRGNSPWIIIMASPICADLAEEACDDMEMEDREQYAATLVEFASAAAANGRLLKDSIEL